MKKDQTVIAATNKHNKNETIVFYKKRKIRVERSS